MPRQAPPSWALLPPGPGLPKSLSRSPPLSPHCQAGSLLPGAHSWPFSELLISPLRANPSPLEMQPGLMRGVPSPLCLCFQTSSVCLVPGLLRRRLMHEICMEKGGFISLPHPARPLLGPPSLLRMQLPLHSPHRSVPTTGPPREPCLWALSTATHEALQAGGSCRSGAPPVPQLCPVPLPLWASSAEPGRGLKENRVREGVS